MRIAVLTLLSIFLQLSNLTPRVKTTPVYEITSEGGKEPYLLSNYL